MLSFFFRATTLEHEYPVLHDWNVKYWLLVTIYVGKKVYIGHIFMFVLSNSFLLIGKTIGFMKGKLNNRLQINWNNNVKAIWSSSFKQVLLFFPTPIEIGFVGWNTSNRYKVCIECLQCLWSNTFDLGLHDPVKSTYKK